jgi:hypothetical protein
MNLPTKEEQTLAAKFLEAHGFKNNAALLRAIARGDLVVCDKAHCVSIKRADGRRLSYYELATSIPDAGGTT